MREIKGVVRAKRAVRVRALPMGAALSREAEEALFGVAEVLSEGRLDDGGAYFGSTMITFALDRLRDVFRGPFDAEALERLRNAVEGSVRMHVRAIRLARAEALRRVPARRLGTAIVESRIRLEGTRLLFDVDFEARVAEPARRAR